MKKPITNDEKQPVDFSGGVRGKHSAAYRRGHTIKIHHDDNSTTVQKFIPDANAMVIDSDVRAYFPDSASVNKALRALIGIMPKRSRRVIDLSRGSQTA
jgi:hypothetical protein